MIKHLVKHCFDDVYTVYSADVDENTDSIKTILGMDYVFKDEMLEKIKSDKTYCNLNSETVYAGSKCGYDIATMYRNYLDSTCVA